MARDITVMTPPVRLVRTHNSLRSKKINSNVLTVNLDKLPDKYFYRSQYYYIYFRI